MVLRSMVALGGLVFVITGLGVLLAESCGSVTWGTDGAQRAGTFTATCNDIAREGAMSRPTAGGLAILLGLVLISALAVPLLRRRGPAVTASS